MAIEQWLVGFSLIAETPSTYLEEDITARFCFCLASLDAQIRYFLFSNKTMREREGERERVRENQSVPRGLNSVIQYERERERRREGELSFNRRAHMT